MNNWFSRNQARREPLNCGSCGGKIVLNPPVIDHRTSRCPHCQADCLLYSCPNFDLQILTDKAPTVLQQVVVWLRANIDELSFVQLVLCISQIAEPERAKWGYEKGELTAYRTYLRGKDKITRDTYNLGSPDDPKLHIPYPPPRDFLWPKPCGS
jgi:hypothetical protein